MAVFCGDVPLRLGGRQRRAVLARLMVCPNRLVDVEALLEDCWGERVTAGSRSTLASHVSQVRRVIGSERLEGRDHGYLLRIEEEELETACFARELDEGRRGLAAGDAAVAVGLLETALARWRGPALGEFADRPWASSEAARLEEQHDLASEALIEAVLAVGDHERAVALAEAAVREEPLREHRSALLMLALYRSGRQSEALETYQRTRRMLVEQLGIEPSGELVAMQSAILGHDPELDHRAASPVRPLAAMRSEHDRHARYSTWKPPATLPVSRTQFFGRAFELIKLTAELPQRRILTLVGPGGAGKSRMALEAARSAQTRFRDGCAWVELARVEDPGEVPSVVATSMNLPPVRDIATAMVDRLSSAQRLLVLDNCEHVLDAVAELVDRLASGCPQVTVLATSREPLGVGGETVWTVGPLELQASVELFEHRALAADAMLTLEEADRELIAEICERAERMPLAIEIAAAHARSVSLDDISRKLPDQLPPAMARRAAPRHRAMSATIDWSWRLLSPDEQRLLSSLSVFPGSWDLRAAHAICALSDSPEVSLRSAGRLVDASLLVVERTSSPTRYRMLQPVREFARERHEQASDTAALQRRHCEHYTRLARELGATVTAPGPNDAAQRLNQEWDNLRAAVNWALDARDLDAVVALVASTGIWALYAMCSEHAEWTNRALKLALTVGRPDASLYVIAAEWAYWADQREHALELAQEAVRLAPESSVEAITAWIRIGYTHARMDDFAAAAAAFAHAERGLANCQDPFTLVTGHTIVHGVICVAFPERREAHTRMVRRAAAELDNPLANALVARTVVTDLLISGEIEQAMAELKPALHAARTAGAIGIENDLAVHAIAPLPLDTSDVAPGELRDTIARLKTSGYGILLDAALEIVAMLWARDGRTDLAGVLLGYLQTQGALYPHPFWVRLRADTLNPVGSDPEAVPHIAHGAAMSQTQVLDLVLAQLATDDPTSNARSGT